MTAKTSRKTARTRPESPYEAFEREKRELATEAGGPIARLAIGVVPFPTAKSKNLMHSRCVTYTMVTRRAGRLWATDLLSDDREPEPLDPATLASRFLPQQHDHVNDDGSLDRRWDNGGVIIVPDRSTASFLARKAGQAGGGYALERALHLLMSLPTSSRLVILTEALGRKFYAPEGLDTGSLPSWLDALGLGRKVSPATVTAALARVRAAEGSSFLPPLDDEDNRNSFLMNEIAAEETRLMRYAASGSLSADCSRYSSVNGIAAHYEYAVQTDALGREYAMLDGTVFRLRPAGRSKARIEGPFKVREGKSIVLVGPGGGTKHGRQDSAVVESITVNDAGEYIATLASMGSEVSKALASGEEHLVITKPFLTMFSGRTGRRWTLAAGEEHSAPAVKRDVPLYVSLAGAPQEAGV